MPFRRDHRQQTLDVAVVGGQKNNDRSLEQAINHHERCFAVPRQEQANQEQAQAQRHRDSQIGHASGHGSHQCVALQQLGVYGGQTIRLNT